ncbi:MAG: hypothetical protein K0R73_41 [Candidatus Midichloriaceae bacterium]|jgi:hypothetical protein|nr:hypothetical protein [Candidatus Midichloriaceae bacterium]
MTAVFKVATPFNQVDDLMPHYKDAMPGLCCGLVIEYARHHFSHNMKGTPAYFMEKLKANTVNPSANFLERVKGYNDSTYFLGDKIYRTNDELLELLHDNNTVDDTILILGLTCIGMNACDHAIAIKIEHKENCTSYKIFDPTYGESIEYTSKQDCHDALANLKSIYLMLSGCKNLSIMVLDHIDILHDLSIISMDGTYTKNSKYAYRLTDAIINKDLAKVHGELGANTKIDYKLVSFPFAIDKKGYTLTPKNIIDLAILKLDESDLIKLININTQMDLEKSLVSTLVHLAFTKKDTPAVLDALIAKLPLENYECRKILEDYKEQHAYETPKDALPTSMKKWLLNEYIKEQNDFLNKVFSSFSDTDIDHQHIYVTEEGELVQDTSVIDLCIIT